MHWTMIFARDNLSRFSVIVVLFGHAMKNPSKAKQHTTLIRKTPSNFIEVSNPYLEACYIIYTREECILIWSRKAVGSDKSEPRAGVKQRKGAHDKAAEKTKLSAANKFQASYPSIKNEDKSDVARRGYFEDLDFYL